MNQPPADEFYRQLHAGTPGDADFYTRLVGESDRVLELGCGWGRLTAGLAERCKSITGVDIDREMCARAQATLAHHPNARILHHDIRHPLPKESPSSSGLKYDRIIAPYNLLYALGGELGVAATFRLVHEQLTADGEFWADVYPVDEMHAAYLAGETPPDDDDEPVGELEWENARYPILESSVLDLRRQRLEVQYRAVRPDDPRTILTRTTLHHDYLLLEQLENLLRDSGLELALVLGSFDGAPYNDEAEHLVLCAKRPSPP